MEHKIYYHDTDAAGVVYYANYLKYFEEARTELFEKAGCSIKEYMEIGFVFAVRSCHIIYQSPARYGEVLVSQTQIVQMKGVRIECKQALYEKVSGRLIVEADIVLVCLNHDFKPVLIPQSIRKAFAYENIN